MVHNLTQLYTIVQTIQKLLQKDTLFSNSTSLYQTFQKLYNPKLYEAIFSSTEKVTQLHKQSTKRHTILHKLHNFTTLNKTIQSFYTSLQNFTQFYTILHNFYKTKKNKAIHNFYKTIQTIQHGHKQNLHNFYKNFNRLQKS